LLKIWNSFEWATYFYILGSCGLRPGKIKSTKTGLRKPAVMTDRAEGFLILPESSTADTENGSLIFILRKAVR